MRTRIPAAPSATALPPWRGPRQPSNPYAWRGTTLVTVHSSAIIFQTAKTTEHEIICRGKNLILDTGAILSSHNTLHKSGRLEMVTPCRNLPRLREVFKTGVLRARIGWFRPTDAIQSTRMKKYASAVLQELVSGLSEVCFLVCMLGRIG